MPEWTPPPLAFFEVPCYHELVESITRGEQHLGEADEKSEAQLLRHGMQVYWYYKVKCSSAHRRRELYMRERAI